VPHNTISREFVWGIVDNGWMANRPQQKEPRWPAVLALLAVGGLRLALPEALSAGPDWLVLAVVGALLIPTIWSRQMGFDKLNKVLGYVITSVVTADMILSLYLLLAALPSHKQAPRTCCVQQQPYGSPISWSSHHGIGGLMREALAPVSYAASIQTGRSYFPR
jgi:hypothetical protein